MLIVFVAVNFAAFCSYVIYAGVAITALVYDTDLLHSKDGHAAAAWLVSAVLSFKMSVLSVLIFISMLAAGTDWQSRTFPPVLFFYRLLCCSCAVAMPYAAYLYRSHYDTLHQHITFLIVMLDASAVLAWSLLCKTLFNKSAVWLDNYMMTAATSENIEAVVQTELGILSADSLHTVEAPSIQVQNYDTHMPLPCAAHATQLPVAPPPSYEKRPCAH
jgi:hypothetical protein